MSRPFSYNDENFTVNGNLLIVHVSFSGETSPNQVICHVPPEISKRLVYNGFMGSYNRSPYSSLSNISLYVRDNDLIISNRGTYSDGQFFAITNLKDI